MPPIFARMLPSPYYPRSFTILVIVAMGVLTVPFASGLINAIHILQGVVDTQRQFTRSSLAITRMEQNFLADGIIDRREFQRLDRALDRAGRSIRSEKHDQQACNHHGYNSRWNRVGQVRVKRASRYS